MNRENRMPWLPWLVPTAGGVQVQPVDPAPRALLPQVGYFGEPALATPADQGQQVREGCEACGGQRRIEPGIERILRPGIERQRGLHAREGGRLTLAQPRIAGEFAIQPLTFRRRGLRRIRVAVQRKELRLGVEPVRVDLLAPVLERGRAGRRCRPGGGELVTQAARLQTQQVRGVRAARRSTGCRG